LLVVANALIMKGLLTILLLAVIWHPGTLNANGGGSASAVMNVSVEAVEPSLIQVERGFVRELAGNPGDKLKISSEQGARFMISSHPESHMSISVTGGNELNDGNGRSVTFTPQISLSNDVSENSQVELNGAERLVEFTENGRDTYRSVLFVDLYGMIDLNGYDEGNFSATYTVRAEHY